MILLKILFAVFYQIGSGQWPPEFDADSHKGVGGVALVEAIFVISISNVIEAKLGHRLALSHWWIWALVLGVVGLNYHLLVSLKIGLNFLMELGSYPARRRALLYALASGIVLIVGLFFFYSVRILRQAFLL